MHVFASAVRYECGISADGSNKVQAFAYSIVFISSDHCRHGCQSTDLSGVLTWQLLV
jgi:hypothetical protein